MTRRIGWLLFSLMGGLIVLPGCTQTLFGRLRSTETRASSQAPSDNTHPTATTGAPGPKKPFSTAAFVEEEPRPTSSVVQKLSPARPAVTPTQSIKAERAGPRIIEGPAAEEKQPTPERATTSAEKTPGLAAPSVSAAPRKRSPLVEALQCMLDDRHQDALKHLQAYDQETQMFFLRILPPLTLFEKKRLDDLSTQDVALLNELLQGLLATLRPRTELVIDKMCYCNWIKAYGIYEALPDTHAFVASTETKPGDLVQLYVELRNFANERTKEGLYETRLSSSAEIRDAQGRVVHAFACPFNDDNAPFRSWTRLNDFFGNIAFYVPVLRPGNYQLTLQIVDETIPELRRVARKNLEFRVTAVSGTAAR